MGCPPGQIRTRVFARDQGTAVVPREIGLICVGPERVITLADLNTDIQRQFQLDVAKKDVGTAPVTVSPPNLALVNLPIIMSTDLVAKNLHITEPLAADVQLVPVPTWDFGDGSAKVTGVIGLPYDGTNAIDDPGHYPLTHQYAKPGTYTITLSVQWTAASVTTARHPDPIPLPDPKPTLTVLSVFNLTTHEAHAVLVTGG